MGKLLREAVTRFGARSDQDHLLLEYRYQPRFLMEVMINSALHLTTDLTGTQLGRYLGR